MKKIVFLSGAGLSAPSGLSTFRDNDGLWDKYDLNIVCNYDSWRQNHTLVHEFYNIRRTELANKQPNAMHHAIASICAQYECMNFTQNVDDLLERAGCSDVIHLHGDLLRLHCHDCAHEFVVHSGYEYDFAPCEQCGSKYIKPSIVFFGESAPLYSLLYAVFGALSSDDLVVIIGTSGAVISVDSLLRRFDGTSVLINLDKSAYIDESRFSHVWHRSCDECADELLSLVSRWHNS